MKNTIKLSIWAALIVLANQVSALGAGSSLDVNMTGSKTFELTMNNVKGDVQLQLKDAKNQVIYQKTIANQGSLKQTFDMGLFSDGAYKIELRDAEKIQSLPLNIENDELIVEVEKERTHFLPVVNQKGDFVSINMLALNGEALSIRILDSSNQVVFRETLAGDPNLGQRYDFSKTDKGEYTIQLTSAGTVTSKEITID